MHGYYFGFDRFSDFGPARGYMFANNPLAFWMMIALMVLFVVTLVLLIVGARKNHRRFVEESEAVLILKRRFAQGELTKEQFDTMKKDLT